MNKQEALKRIEVQKETLIRLTGWAVYVYIEELIKSLDEQKPVKVPQFVADWIEHSRNIGCSLSGAMSMFKEKIEDKKWMQWAEKQEIFARAWLDGYEVEEEKKFFVKIKCLSEEYKYLNYFKSCREWLFSENEETKEYRTAHTRKELEEAGFGWVFDCPGIEIEEVE